MLPAFIRGLTHALYFEHTITMFLANPFSTTAFTLDTRALLWLFLLFLAHNAPDDAEASTGAIIVPGRGWL